MPAMEDWAGKAESARTAPAVARNRDPILSVLQRFLPPRGLILEIASGTGEHAVHFAKGLPGVTWQPSDPDPESLASIAAHRASAKLSNLLAPIELDATSTPWPVTNANAIVAINMIHIAPWTACEGLMAGAERLLPPGGTLYLYGPYKENGVHTAPSNAAFDRSLRQRDPAWGVRDLEAVIAVADRHAFDFIQRIAMPANNLSVVFRRR
jgi:SAM-dependent methyltransferase